MLQNYKNAVTFCAMSHLLHPSLELNGVFPAGENASDMEYLPLCDTCVKGKLWALFRADCLGIVRTSYVKTAHDHISAALWSL